MKRDKVVTVMVTLRIRTTNVQAAFAAVDAVLDTGPFQAALEAGGETLESVETWRLVRKRDNDGTEQKDPDFEEDDFDEDGDFDDEDEEDDFDDDDEEEE